MYISKTETPRQIYEFGNSKSPNIAKTALYVRKHIHSKSITWQPEQFLSHPTCEKLVISNTAQYQYTTHRAINFQHNG
jgi:hypothetical protein